MNIDKKKEIIEETVSKAVGLKLSDSELEQLAKGSSIKFKDLLKNRSFGELGSALIRIDALATAEQLRDVPQLPNADIPQFPRDDVFIQRRCFTVLGRRICLNLFPAPDSSESLALNVEIS